MPEPEVQAIVAELTVKYPLFAAATIQRWVDRVTARYTNASVRTFVPILVRRAVERTLRDLDTIEVVELNKPNPYLQPAR